MSEEIQKTEDESSQADALEAKLKKIEEETALMLENKPEIKKYLERFQIYSVKHFLEDYPKTKANWFRYEKYAEERSNSDHNWFEMAYEHLQTIQHKKIFDLQCLWRAEKITIPEIQICFDFEVVVQDCLHCKLVEPITAEEISRYQHFLRTAATHTETFRFGLQDYEEIMEANKTDEGMPEWFEYENNFSGSGAYLLLPDIRGQKEAVYIELGRNEKFKNTPEVEFDNREHISVYNEELMMDFINRFETKATRSRYRQYCDWSAGMEESSTLDELISDLLKSPTPVPIEANHDFAEAIRIAHFNYEKNMIADFMPAAYEAYRIELSMDMEDKGEDNHTEFYKSLRQTWYEYIITGRLLSGEPGDLNF